MRIFSAVKYLFIYIFYYYLKKKKKTPACKCMGIRNPNDCLENLPALTLTDSFAGIAQSSFVPPSALVLGLCS